jgi:hypothetical protein
MKLVAVLLIVLTLAVALERSPPPIHVNLDKARDMADSMAINQETWMQTVNDEEVASRADVARKPPMVRGQSRQPCQRMLVFSPS